MKFTIWLIENVKKGIKSYSRFLGRSKEIDERVKKLVQDLIDSIKEDREQISDVKDR